MDVSYTDRAKHSGEGDSLLQQTSARLEKVIGAPAAGVKAEWDRIEDEKGRSLFTLRLSDATGTVATSFTPDELKSAAAMRIRLHHIWGDLLKVRSDLQHRKVLEQIEEMPPLTSPSRETPSIEFTQAELDEMGSAGITLDDAIRAVEQLRG